MCGVGLGGWRSMGMICGGVRGVGPRWRLFLSLGGGRPPHSGGVVSSQRAFLASATMSRIFAERLNHSITASVFLPQLVVVSQWGQQMRYLFPEETSTTGS